MVIAGNAEYYQLNPQKLQQALQNCPAKHPTGVACDELAELGAGVNRLVAELQMNPQSYGLSIITLQTTIAEQIALQKHHPSSHLQQQIGQNQQILRERLSVIKWLESPHRSEWFHHENIS